jgi:hypothetical protein
MPSVASFLTQSLPVIAPLITDSAGLAPESIGNLAALIAAGTMLFLLLGGPFSHAADRCGLCGPGPRSRH